MPFVAPVHTPPVWQTAPAQQAPLRAPQFLAGTCSAARGRGRASEAAVAGVEHTARLVGAATRRAHLRGPAAAALARQAGAAGRDAAAAEAAALAASCTIGAARGAHRARGSAVTAAARCQRATRAGSSAGGVPPLAPQRIRPIAPHAVPAAFWHEPLVQVPVVLPLPQVVPAPTHIPPTQQPPPLQVLEAQQAWPAPPHAGPAAPPVPVPVLPAVPPDVPAVPVVPPLPFTDASLPLIVEVLLPHAATTNDSAEAITSAGNAPMPMLLERSD